METTDTVTVRTNWPASNVARVEIKAGPTSSRAVRRITQEILSVRGFVIDGPIAADTTSSLFLLVIKPFSEALLDSEA